jgi:hypothetical protein
VVIVEKGGYNQCFGSAFVFQINEANLMQIHADPDPKNIEENMVIGQVYIHLQVE